MAFIIMIRSLYKLYNVLCNIIYNNFINYFIFKKLEFINCKFNITDT